MTRLNILKSLAFSSALFVGLFATSTANAVALYEVEAAEADPVYSKFPGGHVFWFEEFPVLFPGASRGFVFDSNGGGFVENDGGTAFLFGRLINLLDASLVFDLALAFDGRTSIPPAGSPKRELKDEAYSDHVPPGPVDTDDWYYYTDTFGTLDGSASGLPFYLLSGKGPAFQVGVGANGKNVEFGASGWLDVEDLFTGEVYNGDINIDLKRVPDAGSSALLLGVSFAAMLFVRRRFVR